MEITVGDLSDLPPGSAATVVRAGEREIAVFKTGAGLFALDNRCAHRGGPLSEGLVRDGIVTCPGHWWRYELVSGRCLGSDVIAVASNQVTVRDGTVVVDIPESHEQLLSVRDRLLEHARNWERQK